MRYESVKAIGWVGDVTCTTPNTITGTPDTPGALIVGAEEPTQPLPQPPTCFAATYPSPKCCGIA